MRSFVAKSFRRIMPRVMIAVLFVLEVAWILFLDYAFVRLHTPRPMGARHTWGRDVRVASPVNRDHTREHKRKSEFCFAVGNETRNPPGRDRNPIKRWRVAHAQVAKKPNHKSS